MFLLALVLFCVGCQFGAGMGWKHHTPTKIEFVPITKPQYEIIPMSPVPTIEEPLEFKEIIILPNYNYDYC